MKLENVFHIGDKLVATETSDTAVYTITDIVYSLKFNQWFYRYIFWEHGFEHYCENTREWVEDNMKVKELAQC